LFLGAFLELRIVLFKRALTIKENMMDNQYTPDEISSKLKFAAKQIKQVTSKSSKQKL